MPKTFRGIIQRPSERFLLEQNKRYEEFLRASKRALYSVDLHSGEMSWTGNAEDLLEISVDRVPSQLKDWLDLIHPEDRVLFQEIFESGDPKLGTQRTFYRIMCPAGKEKMVRDDQHLVVEEGTDSSTLVGVIEDATDYHRLLEEHQFLGAEERRLKAILNASPDALLALTADGKIQIANEEAKRIFALDDEIITELYITELFSLGSLEQVEAILTEPEKLKGGQYELLAQAGREKEFPVELRVNSFFVDEQNFLFFGIRDITSDKILAESRETLLAELDHRVKNTLNIVLSIAKQTLRRASGLEDFQVAFEGRLLALAKTHQLLTANKWESLPLSELLREVTKPYTESKGPFLEVSGQELHLSPKASQALYLVFHELSTNAAKYGAFSTEYGSTSVDWTITDAQVRLCWVESGGPRVEKPTKTGFGTELLERVLSYQLGAELVTEYPASGFRGEMTLPLNDDLSPAPCSGS